MVEKLKKYRIHKKNFVHISSLFFIVGVLVSLIFGFFAISKIVGEVLVGFLMLFGIIIGLMNITRKEASGFLIATLTLVLLLGPFLGMLNQYFFQAVTITRIFTYFIALIVPAAILVALKQIFIFAEKQ